MVMYIQDLASYREMQETWDRFQTENDLPIKKYLSVGWLDKKHEYSKGEVSQDLQDKLRKICVDPPVLSAGYHECEFCVPSARPRTPCSHKYSFCREGHWLGSGVFMLKDPRDPQIEYVVPDMVIHYVEAHDYCPPIEVLHALEFREVTKTDSLDEV